MKPLITFACIGLLTTLFLGCSDSSDSEAAKEPEKSTSPSQTGEPKEDEPEKPVGQPAAEITNPAQLEAALRAKNPGYQGGMRVGPGPDSAFGAVMIHDPTVRDISPLSGLPLDALDLSFCHISDISDLKGMPLTKLFLEGTAVSDISVVKEMPLEILYLASTRVKDLSPLAGSQTLKQLYLMNTKVTDLTPLKDTKLESLWLTGSGVTGIGPLKTVPLISLTLADTKVSDLSPLKGHPTLQRLHVARTDVTDLTPLEGLKLTRLIFTPNRIKKGIDVARKMNLREIDVEFPPARGGPPMSPLQFWRRYDAGEFK
ncbi:MAG: leucine-rich repeat domain-containing protein [Thermoguttaceae bacterium]